MLLQYRGVRKGLLLTGLVIRNWSSPVTELRNYCYHAGSFDTRIWFYVGALCSAELFLCGTNGDTVRTSLNCKQTLSSRGSTGSELCSGPRAVPACPSVKGRLDKR